MHIHLGSAPGIKRYLTLFYGFTLGLGLLLAALAMSTRPNADPKSPALTQAAAITQAITRPTASLTESSAQSLPTHTPTSLPAIPATPDEKTPSPLGLTSAELRGLTVSLWHPWTGAEETALQAIVDEFNRTNRWGITALATAYPGFGALEEAVGSTLTTGTLPDVLVDYGYQARHLDNNGAVVDLAPYIQDPVWGWSSAEQADFYQGFWGEDLADQGASGKGRRLAVPYYRSAYALFYNRSWAQDLGFSSPPKTPDEFRMQACTAAVLASEKAHQSVPEQGGLLLTTQPGALLGWMYAYGADITVPGAETYSLNTPEAQQALSYLKELQEAGCAWMEPGADPQALFASRGALFMVASLLDISAQQAAFAQSGSSDEWTIIPFPSKSKPVVEAYGPSWMVTRSTLPRQMAGWLVIEWLMYPPNQALWVETLQAYPTRLSSLNYLGDASLKSPQWAQSLELLRYARSEPTFPSWVAMRWALQEASTVLFDIKFTRGQIPALLQNMDNLAAEVAAQVH